MPTNQTTHECQTKPLLNQAFQSSTGGRPVFDGGNPGRSKRISREIEALQEDVEAWATIEGLEAVRDDMSKAERRLTVGTNRERMRARLRRLVKPAGYLAAGALAVYLVEFVVMFLVVPELLAGVLIGGIGGMFGVAVGTGIAVYA